ncbi:hypothetical protein P152DRAFT_459719 [Eremomyces bilateralis CBS 781.70]|uniref:PDZ GRASP-type domain-containing protein n=1 Tax=Eremomyces bilateralis CBS 781.70 TaxID=1392243 RepID=A0A6G1G066_9PEZI|nr:uncharacterized protein P152DRAFT_459719 [Eremomyces bilateralis CBS 781.70]KAF1811321.1 hypothetical protein P152DRAFT_459719 [Eremomyces bilateralis CBS 781.70]
MFGALNRIIGRLDAEPEQQHPLHRASGFQVLRNANPDIPIEPWFDFVIGINGRSIDSPDPDLFATEVRNCGGTSISLGVWSAKGQRIRELYVQVPKDAPALGMSMQWNPLNSTEDVWHILDVTANSPADQAGLLPYGDYVVGSPEGVVRGESGLGELVEDFLNRPLRLYVYNHEYNVVRPVTITPSRSWGGQGALGCVLGFGALHRIPPPLDEPPQAPGETLYETPSDSRPPSSISTEHPAPTPTPATNLPSHGDFLVPANLLQSPPPPKSPDAPAAHGVKHGRKGRHHAPHARAGSPGNAMDAYFAEGEEKSRMEDREPSRAGGGVPPPPKSGPPKSGGPPRGPPRANVEEAPEE